MYFEGGGGRGSNRQNDSGNFKYEDDDGGDDDDDDNNNNNNRNSSVSVYAGTLSFPSTCGGLNSPIYYFFKQNSCRRHCPPNQLQFITLFFMLPFMLNEEGEMR